MSMENEKSFDFDNEIDSEIEEEAFIEYLRMLKERDDKRGVIRVPNFPRIKEMEKSVNMLESIIEKYKIKAKVEFGIEELGYGGYVRIKCPAGFCVTDVPELCEALEKASNTEFVIENDMVQIGIIFDGAMLSHYLS